MAWIKHCRDDTTGITPGMLVKPQAFLRHNRTTATLSAPVTLAQQTRTNIVVDDTTGITAGMVMA